MLWQLYDMVPKWLRRRLGGARRGLPADGGMLDGVQVQARWLDLTRPTVPVPGLARPWDGVRIAHLSDLHAGRICGAEYLLRVVERTNAAAADLVVITGDVVSEPEAASDALVGILARLRAPLGRLAVLGNHDLVAGRELVESVLARAGFELLDNTHTMLTRDGAALCIAGVDDWKHGRPDARRALAGADPAAARVVLCHNPDYIAHWPAGVRAEVALCGHTHGGQVRLPFGAPPTASIRHRRYIEGLVRGPGLWVYTTRGVGMSHLPVRWNCRPELPVITLRRAADSPHG